MLFYTIVLPLGFLLLFFTFFIVKQQSAAVVERFGKFVSVRQSGLQLKVPIIDNPLIDPMNNDSENLEEAKFSITEIREKYEKTDAKNIRNGSPEGSRNQSQIQKCRKVDIKKGDEK